MADPIEKHPKPSRVGNMTNAPAVIDPERRAGKGETDDRKKGNTDRIRQGAGQHEAQEGEGRELEEMDERELLGLLDKYEADSAQYITGTLREQRDAMVKAYFQQPYGNEQPGWSQYVSAVVAETVEWMVPDLLDLFLSSDKAVVFEPTRAEEEQNAADATAGVNHVFYEQNNGFLILHTVIKDMLTVKTCAVHWFPIVKRRMCRVPFRDATDLDVELLKMKYPGAKVEAATPTIRPLTDMTGQPMRDRITGEVMTQTVYTGRLSYVEQKKTVRVDAFEPEQLGVLASWTSPLLEECPYVVRWVEMSLSDLTQLADDMGFEPPTAAELKSSIAPTGQFDLQYKRDRTGDPYNVDLQTRPDGIDSADESQTTGWVRIEWVLVDVDRDGISERREIWRLKDQILYNEEVPEVPVCTGSPILIPHRWDGQAVAETMLDLQALDTELTRGVVNNAYNANNPRKIVLVDKNGASFAEQDDVLDGRPGGYIRTTRLDALSLEATEYVGEKMEPLLQRVDQLREQRSGITKQRMGMDPNALVQDRTLGEVRIVDQASKQRTKLIGRVIAEIVMKPMFRGILRLLTSGGFDPLFFKLRGRYVNLDPNEWADHYTLTTNVGLGTGDTEQLMAALGGIYNRQVQLAQTPIGPGMVTPHQLYSSTARMVELSGFKNVGEFFLEPPKDAKMPDRPAPPPPWQLQAKQMELQAKDRSDAAQRQFDMAKLALEARQKAQAAADQNNVQMQNDERDAAREARAALDKQELEALKVLVDKYKADLHAQTQLDVARLSSDKTADPASLGTTPEGEGAIEKSLQPVMDALQAIYEQSNQPITAVRHPETGDIVGVRRGDGPVRPVVRDAAGRVVGVQ